MRGGSRPHGRPWAESPLWERRQAALLCHSHCASHGAAIPQSSLRTVLLYHSHRIERCCYAQSSLCAVLLCHSHCASRCAAIPLHRVLDHATQNANGSPLQSIASSGAAMHSHRFARCCSATATALRAVLLYHSHRFMRCWVCLCHSHRFVRCWVPMPWQSRSAVPGRRRRGADVPGGAATTNIGRRVSVRAGVQVSVWRG